MELQTPVGPLLGQSGHLARERMDARLACYDVTPAQTRALMYLNRQGGTVSQCELIEHLRVKPSTANGILDRLEEKKLITRCVSGSDARRRTITLTEKGLERQTQFQQVFQEVEHVMLRGFTPEESHQFYVLLGRVIHNLEEDRTL